MFDTQKFLQNISQALRLCAQRGIVIGGWSGITELDTSEGSVQCVTEVPYEWLFPRASCIIHHGGCGTVGAVLRAGKPSILLPQITCQEHFARMLDRERLATGIFDAHTLNPADLASAIQRALTDEQFAQSAHNWQHTVSEERGIETAADLIEVHYRSIRSN